jgi:hypothetical protein
MAEHFPCRPRGGVFAASACHRVAARATGVGQFKHLDGLRVWFVPFSPAGFTAILRDIRRRARGRLCLVFFRGALHQPLGKGNDPGAVQ